MLRKSSWTQARPSSRTSERYGIVDGEIEKLVAVVAEVALGGLAGLQAIGAHEAAGLEIADHQVVAKGVKGIDVEANTVGSGEPFLEFEVKD